MMASGPAHAGGGHQSVHPSTTTHPAVQAMQDAVSHMAASHAAAVVHHLATTHAHGHAPLPSFQHYVQHQAAPHISGPLAQALAHLIGPLQGTGGMVMGPNGQWIPQAAAPQGTTVDPSQNQAPQYQGAPDGNNSIASNGGGNGLLSMLMSAL